MSIKLSKALTKRKVQEMRKYEGLYSIHCPKPDKTTCRDFWWWVFVIASGVAITAIAINHLIEFRGYA